MPGIMHLGPNFGNHRVSGNLHYNCAEFKGSWRVHRQSTYPARLSKSRHRLTALSLWFVTGGETSNYTLISPCCKDPEIPNQKVHIVFVDIAFWRFRMCIALWKYNAYEVYTVDDVHATGVCSNGQMSMEQQCGFHCFTHGT